MKVKLTLNTDPQSISLDEAEKISRRSKNQLHGYCLEDKIDYGVVKGMRGRRIITNEKWDAFLKGIKDFEKKKKQREKLKKKDELNSSRQ
jgi:hypothetical protein